MKKTWIITGSSSGIGLEMTKKLLQAGKKVMGISRRQALIDSMDYQQLFCDFSNLDNINQLQFEKNNLEGVIFCHGYGEFKHLEEFKQDAMISLMNVNLLSIMIMTKNLIQALKKQPQAYLIFIGSEAGLDGKTRSSVYSASKFGLRGFVQSIRKECASSAIKVTIIQPGLTRTPFYDNQYFEPKADEKCAIAPQDIAATLDIILAGSVGTTFDEIIINPQAHAIKFKN